MIDHNVFMHPVTSIADEFTSFDSIFFTSVFFLAIWPKLNRYFERYSAKWLTQNGFVSSTGSIAWENFDCDCQSQAQMILTFFKNGKKSTEKIVSKLYRQLLLFGLNRFEIGLNSHIFVYFFFAFRTWWKTLYAPLI